MQRWNNADLADPIAAWRLRNAAGWYYKIGRQNADEWTQDPAQATAIVGTRTEINRAIGARAWTAERIDA